jgi:UDP-N-acetylmuramoylalanine--D-glutamate ligase
MKTQTSTLERKIDQQLVQVRKENIKRLNDIEHRLEYVDMVNGIEYVNDAKAADINSSWYSIDCMEKPIVWIISSCPYEDDYSLFEEIDTDKVKAMVVLGKNPDAIEAIFSGKVQRIQRADDLLDAVAKANTQATEGDLVLYSPAFSDLDEYKHYKENGQAFRKAVREVQLMK